MPLNGNYAPSTSERARASVEKIIASGGTEGIEVNGAGVVLLTCVGAKTRAIRKTPMIRVEHDGQYAIVASLRGGPNNPAWYHNVKAHPDVSIEVGTDTVDVRASEAETEERNRLYAAQEQRSAAFTEYQEKAGRTIPVIVLTPR